MRVQFKFYENWRKHTEVNSKINPAKKNIYYSIFNSSISSLLSCSLFASVIRADWKLSFRFCSCSCSYFCFCFCSWFCSWFFSCSSFWFFTCSCFCFFTCFCSCFFSCFCCFCFCFCSLSLNSKGLHSGQVLHLETNKFIKLSRKFKIKSQGRKKQEKKNLIVMKDSQFLKKNESDFFFPNFHYLHSLKNILYDRAVAVMFHAGGKSFNTDASSLIGSIFSSKKQHKIMKKLLERLVVAVYRKDGISASGG